MDRRSVNVKPKHFLGKTPLHLIYDHIDENNPVQADDCLPVIQALLDNGADVNAQTWYTRGMRPLTPLAIAVDKYQINGVKLLLQNGADVYVRYEDKSYSILHNAVSKVARSDEIIKQLLSHGADPNHFDDHHNQTPFTQAAKVNRLDFIKILMDAGGQINQELKYGDSALLWACRHGNVEMMEYLVSHGARLDLDNKYLQAHTPIHVYAYHRNATARNTQEDVERIVEILVEQGVDVNALNFEKNTALHVAAAKEDTRLIQVLLKYDVSSSINVRNSEEEIPLHLLLSSKYSKVCGPVGRLFLQLGSDINSTNKMGSTVWDLCWEYGQSAFAQITLAEITGLSDWLLDARYESLVFPTVFPDTVRQMCELGAAAIVASEEVVDRLIDMGYLDRSRAMPRTVEGYSPLYCAIGANRYNIVKIFLETGCTLERPIDFTNYHYEDESSSAEINLELVCLILEFADLSFLCKSLELFFKQIQNFGSNLYFNHVPLFNLMVEYLVIKLHTNENENDLILSKSYIQENKKLSKLLRETETNLDSMKKIEVCEGLSKFYILTASMSSFIRRFHSKCVRRACKKLSSDIKTNKPEPDQHFQVIVSTRIDLAIERYKLAMPFKAFLDKCFKILLRNNKCSALPDFITLNIISYLPSRDLKKLKT